MSRIARSLCAAALVLGLVSIPTPAAAAPSAGLEGIADALAAWYGHLVAMLRGEREATKPERANGPGEQGDGGTASCTDATCDGGGTENGPGIDPNG